MEDPTTFSLRERKQRRTREAIIEAALKLFGEQGFDAVTVTDIAARADVGRSTFFRYFTDKQEVLFADDPQLLALVVAASEHAAKPAAPLGGSLAGALIVARAGLLALTSHIAEHSSQWLALRARLIDQHAELRARNLIKERGYIAAAIEVMQRNGARPTTAVLAANVAAACYAAGHAHTLATGQDLRSAVEDAFDQLAMLDSAALRRPPPGKRGVERNNPSPAPDTVPGRKASRQSG